MILYISMILKTNSLKSYQVALSVGIIPTPPCHLFPRYYKTISLLSPYLTSPHPYAGLKHHLWLYPAKTLDWMQRLQYFNITEVHIPTYHADLVSFQRAKPGDLIFVEQNAYFIEKDVGRMPVINTARESL